MFKYIPKYLHIYAYVITYFLAYIIICVQKCIHSFVHGYLHIRIHIVYTFSYIHTCMHTYIHVYMNIYIYMHKNIMLRFLCRDLKEQIRSLGPSEAVLYTWQDPSMKRELIWSCGEAKEVKDGLIKVTLTTSTMSSLTCMPLRCFDSLLRPCMTSAAQYRMLQGVGCFALLQV